MRSNVVLPPSTLHYHRPSSSSSSSSRSLPRSPHKAFLSGIVLLRNHSTPPGNALHTADARGDGGYTIISTFVASDAQPTDHHDGSTHHFHILSKLPGLHQHAALPKSPLFRAAFHTRSPVSLPVYHMVDNARTHKPHPPSHQYSQSSDATSYSHCSYCSGKSPALNSAGILRSH